MTRGATAPPQEALRDLESKLRWVEGALASVPSDTLRQSLAKQVETIRRRNADPVLRIGFFGQFSSGKSTLINALLTEPLLPVLC